MIFTNANQTGTIRKETLNTREYVVAPVIAIREGVLNDELVPTEEIAKSVFAWDDRPIVLGHPQLDGKHISARGPATLEQYNVGRFYNVHLDADKLKGEVWVDVLLAQTSNDGRELLRRLLAGEAVEVSTAYDRQPQAVSGEYNGQHYDSVARDIIPDHLAMLLNDIGACSWADGCGAPRVNQQGGNMQLNILGEARRPTFDSKTEEEWTRPRLEDYGYDVTSIDELTAEQRNRIASGSLLGDPDAETFSDLSFFPVVTPGGALSRRALMAVIGGRGAQADIPQAAKDSAQAMARRLLESEFEMESEVQNEGKIKAALRTLFEFVGLVTPHGNEQSTQQEVSVMEELIAKIMADGRLGLTEEEMQAMPESALAKLAAHLELIGEAAPEPEPEPEPEQADAQPDQSINDGGDPVSNAAQPCSKLAAIVEQVGGADKALEILTNADKASKEQREKWTAVITANAQGVDLSALDDTTLQAMAKAFEEKQAVDYSGQGGGIPQVNTEKVEVEISF